MQAALRARGEPSRWATLQWAAAAALSGRVPAEDEEVLPAMLKAIEAAAGTRGPLERLGAQPSDELNNGLWWLADAGPAQAPLADRVEAEVQRQLAHGEPMDERDLLPAVYATFPGAQTPGLSLVQAVLESYAEQTEFGLWQLRPEDAPERRAADRAATLAHLRTVAGRCTLTTQGADVVQWCAAGEPLYAFAVLTTARLAEVLLQPAPEAARQRYLVLPGGRVALAEYKLRRDPRLRAAFEAGGWDILKYRHVRRLAAEAAVTPATLEAALAGDPVVAAQQLALPE
jgi:hypothetical protein